MKKLTLNQKQASLVWGKLEKKLTSREKLEKYDQEVRLSYFDRDGNKTKKKIDRQ